MVEPRRRARWIFGVLGALASVLVAGAIGFVLWIRVPPVDSDTDTAVALFTRVLHGETGVLVPEGPDGSAQRGRQVHPGRADSSTESELEARALGALAGAVERSPDDARAALWFGLANMHGFLRARELPYAIRASRALDRAVELAPEDGGTAGWRAFWAYQVARSREDELDAARDELLAASERDPRFTPFLAAVALASLPISSGYPERVAAQLEAIEDCGDGTSHSCRAAPLFPHGAEGFHATLGDLRVRLGDVEGGRAQYARALEMSAAPSWPYRGEFEEWARGADERARLLTNDDPADDPTIFFASGVRACTVCHAR